MAPILAYNLHWMNAISNTSSTLCVICVDEFQLENLTQNEIDNATKPIWLSKLLLYLDI